MNNYKKKGQNNEKTEGLELRGDGRRWFVDRNGVMGTS